MVVHMESNPLISKHRKSGTQLGQDQTLWVTYNHGT
jgi:hypothetical protein